MEEKTKNLTMDEKLDLVLTELADVKAPVVKLEAFAEERSRDTKPVLGQIHAHIANTRIEMRERFERVDERFRELEKPIALVREDARMAHRTTKLIFDEMVRARVEWDDTQRDVQKLKGWVEKLEAA